MANTDCCNCSRPRARAGSALSARLGIAVSVMAALGACSSVPDAANPIEWYKSAEQAVFGGPATADTTSTEAGASAYRPPEVPGRDQPFPNLGEGPERPVPRTPAETAQLTEGLVADRARARHSDLSVPLQGMSGERRMAFPATDGEVAAAPPSSAEVIRTPIGPTRAARADGAPQRPAEPRTSSGASEHVERASPPAQRAGSAAAAPGQTVATRDRLAFSDAPPPSASPAPPPRPRFSDAPPPTLGLSSAPPQPQQPAVTADPRTAAHSALPPPPPPGSGAPDAGAVPAPVSEQGAPFAPEQAGERQPGDAPGTAAEQPLESGPVASRDLDPQGAAQPLVEEDEMRDGPAENMAMLKQIPDPATAPARSERIATIQFGGSGPEIGERERDILRQVAALHQQRGGMIRVVAHGGEASGGNSSAQDVTETGHDSLERANVVAQELIRLGVKREEIRAVALAGSAAESAEQATEIYFVY